MNAQIQFIKNILPNLVKNSSQFFEIDFSIKLFGVKVFAFHWPPHDEENVEQSN